jgi:hypothetical protein
MVEVLAWQFSAELGHNEDGDRIGWFGDLTGQDDMVWEDGSWAGEKGEGVVAAACIGHPG